ncbi:Alpha/beta hydrolase family protein [Enhygromyxa salina]|uniref:Alpha/beta hydrolase family protein n=1 Tax=Enhygromyxa salina TaxID=215803 RepID=A0A2S9XBC8_9BACT|nr:alpha/beta hydrolase [Enhygromyxa salina]PRP90155.1 Alpha/beta hydrolase family protein [Enhygromyxa salina]
MATLGTRVVFVSSLVSVLSGCAGQLEAPIPTAAYGGDGDHARALVIMLPGAGDRVGTYDKHGFVQTMRDSGMDVDMLEVDAHIGYYRSRTLLERLEHDVLAPNRDRYEEIWLVGISMGGLGALLTTWTYPEEVDGLILMAPYLGRRKILGEIERAGGLAAWQPPAEIDDARWDIEIWRMLQQISAQQGAGETELYLMYGEDDFGARAHRILAGGLPVSHVKTAPGGHAWGTWTTLWNALMSESPIAS